MSLKTKQNIRELRKEKYWKKKKEAVENLYNSTKKSLMMILSQVISNSAQGYITTTTQTFS